MEFKTLSAKEAKINTIFFDKNTKVLSFKNVKSIINPLITAQELTIAMSQVSVTTDGTTITGSGTQLDPLIAIGGESIETVYNNLAANGITASSGTILEYGVNVFTIANSTNYAAKLPQPTTGKSTIIINNTTSSIKLYPSNVGGQINNYPIDTPAIIPPDGKSYTFICIVNPLPGQWVWSAPATGQYDSGTITMTLTGTGNANNPTISAYDNTFKNIVTGFISYPAGNNGKNKSFVQGSSSPDAIFFKPPVFWNGLAKIKVYTNATVSSIYQLLAAGETDYYDISTGSIITNGEVGTGAFVNAGTSNIITGTILDPGNLIQPFIGAPGTYWGETVIINPNMQGLNNSSAIGDIDFGNVLYPFTFPSEYVGELVQKYYSAYLSFSMTPFGFENYGTKDFQFRFIIEYY